LCFLPDPRAVFRSPLVSVWSSASRLLSTNYLGSWRVWAPFPLLAARLPLGLPALLSSTSLPPFRCEHNRELASPFTEFSQRQALPAPTMNLDKPLGNDPEFTRWSPTFFGSFFRKFSISIFPSSPLVAFAYIPPQSIKRSCGLKHGCYSWMPWLAPGPQTRNVASARLHSLILIPFRGCSIAAPPPSRQCTVHIAAHRTSSSRFHPEVHEFLLGSNNTSVLRCGGGTNRNTRATC